MDAELERHLNGYNLPQDALWEIKRILEKRYKTRFWEGMSPEGREAMQQVIESDVDSVDGYSNLKHSAKSKASDRTRNKHSQESRRHRTISFSDTYKKSASSILSGDITDANFKGENLKKRAIGGKLESAMETIEIVKHGEIKDDNKTNDEAAKAEAAKLNSVEKCLVWMEVNDDVTESGAIVRSATPKW